MDLCINDSGTWRSISTLCVNNSGTWRCVCSGKVNDSGTWRSFRNTSPIVACPLGTAMEGGLLFCRSSGVGWIISDSTTQISRVWADRADIVTVVEAAISCGDWFVPMCTPMVSAANCKAYWDEPGGTSWFWTNQDFISHAAYAVGIYSSYVSRGFRPKVNSMYLRAFRCVSY